MFESEKEQLKQLSELELRILFIVTALICIMLLIIGIRAWIRMFSIKVIHRFPFQDDKMYLNFTSIGRYSIYLEGSMFQQIKEGWHPEINSNENGEKIVVNPVLFRIHQTGFSRAKAEMFIFKITNKGEYTFQVIPEPKGAISHARYTIQQFIHSNLKLKNSQKLSICIAKGHSDLQKIILFPQLFLAFIGLLGLIFSIILSVNPFAFQQ